MAIIFYYILNSDLEKIKEGITIEKFSNKTLFNNGISKPCIIGFLNPRDDINKYHSDEYICLELDVDVKHCFVLNGDLYNIEDKKYYYNSIIPLGDYKYGLYRNPEIAVLCDIAHKNVNIYNDIIGSPIIFSNSDELYKNNLFEELRQRYGDFDETMLGIFFMLMAHKGKYTLIGKNRNNKKTLYIYQDNITKKNYTLEVVEGLSNNKKVVN